METMSRPRARFCEFEVFCRPTTCMRYSALVDGLVEVRKRRGYRVMERALDVHGRRTFALTGDLEIIDGRFAPDERLRRFMEHYGLPPHFGGEMDPDRVRAMIEASVDRAIVEGLALPLQRGLKRPWTGPSGFVG